MDYISNARTVFDQMFAMLDRLVEKATGAGMGDDILAAKLADDMFPLETQFRIAVNQVIIALNRLCGSETPLQEEPYASLEEVRQRIAAIRAEVADTPSDRWAEAAVPVDFTLPNSMRFVMSAAEYVRDWTLPNVYFHTTMAYALLRQNGLAIGKADFLPQMAQYARRPES